MTLKTSPETFYQQISVKDYAGVFAAPDNSIALIKKELGPEKLRAFLVLVIVDLVEFFSVSNSMNNQQIIQTADLIAEEYYYMKPEDFKLCFNKAKKGKLGTGQVYNRIDGAVIFKWLEEYAQERADQATNQYLVKHDEIKGQIHMERKSEIKQIADKEKEFHEVRLDQFKKEQSHAQKT